MKQYSKCDLVILQFTQNQFDSFEKLTSINKMLQDETNNLPNIVLLSSCSDIFPKINKKVKTIYLLYSFLKKKVKFLNYFSLKNMLNLMNPQYL